MFPAVPRARRSAIRALVAAALQVEGVIHVDQHVTYDFDDRYPSTSFS
jgi:hypothetical protein